MRVIAGRHRGLRLAALGKGDAGAHLRPTPDRVRESLFSILAGHGLPEGVAVLDLFAGTGAQGIEALSRGATHATFVETGRPALRLIRDNLDRAGRTGDASVLPVDARRLPPCPGDAAALVFLDPPYGKGLGAPAIGSAFANGWIAPAAIIVWEEAAPQDPVPGTALVDRRTYGATHLTILEAEAGS